MEYSNFCVLLLIKKSKNCVYFNINKLNINFGNIIINFPLRFNYENSKLIFSFFLCII